MRRDDAGVRLTVRVRMLVASLMATLVLAGCGNAIPRSEPPRGAGSRPATSRPPARPAVSRPVVQPLPPQRTAPPPARLSVDRPPAGLESAIHELWRSFPGRTGIAVRLIDGNWAVGRRGDEFFPQQSVSKTWVALTLFDRIDAGGAAMTDMVRIGPEDLTLFHQPLATRVAREGPIRLSVAELLELAITTSDNTANDSLLRHVGGPDVVRRYLQVRGLNGIRFGPGERLLQSGIAGMSWRQDYSIGRAFQAARAQVPEATRRAALNRYIADPIDGATPFGITDALARLARGELLSPASTRAMLDTMARTRSGPQRLRAGVPVGWSVAHKTGTGQEFDGRSTGYNDIAILTAPDGTRYAVAVMLAETTASVPQRMQLMQAVSRTVAAYHGQ